MCKIPPPTFLCTPSEYTEKNYSNCCQVSQISHFLNFVELWMTTYWNPVTRDQVRSLDYTQSIAVLEKYSQREISLSLRNVWYFWMPPCSGHIFLPRFHIGSTWRIRLNRPCSDGQNEAAAMQLYVKVLWPLFCFSSYYYYAAIIWWIKIVNKTANMHKMSKRCNLYTLLTATEQKLQKCINSARFRC